MNKPDLPDYKDTILLPQTAFPMRGELPKTEPQRIEKWKSQKTYQKMSGEGSGKKLFVMPDGPPYANGNLHVGHVLNKVLKDMVIKYKNMSGCEAQFIPGWDCHGLPIELKVTTQLGDKRKDLSDQEVRALCRKEALHWVEEQKKQFVRLGVLADWDNPYLTLHAEYEAEEIRVLAQILRKGVLFRGEKPVYWCPTLQTALAAAEIEYRDHKSPSIYLKFNVTDKKTLAALGSPKKATSFVIWTTTPWTIPANHGISLNPDFEYGLFEHQDEILIFATALKEAIEKDTGLQFSNPISTFKGSVFDRMNARHPFLDRDSLIMIGDHVTSEAGTGCVHTAPGHGLDNYVIGMKYGLPVHSPVDGGGKYTSEFAEYEGVHIWKANKLLVEKMQNSGHLLFHKEIVHSYPHNPRSKTPLIFRATPQWFVRMDDEKFPVRKTAIDTAESEIQFFPKWGSQRLISMISNSPDWCLSRQRIWGVPIPVFYCQSCGEALASADLMDKIADLMESSKEGLEAYHSRSVKELIGNQKCSACGHTEFDKGKDILDVWFDSGVCHSAVQKKRKGMAFPADVYLEGSDQHRGWFQTSLISSIAANGQSPFKALITHGFVNDAQGHKMSKSQGNVIDPAKIIEKFGAEILRLWVAHEDYGDDVTVGDEMFQRISEAYRRFRNTMRFLLGNLHDFNPEKDLVAFKDMPALDRWALLRLNEVNAKVSEAFERYEFFKVYHALNNFFTVDLSAIYLDTLKDRLYTWKSDGRARKSSQTVLYHLLHRLCGMMAPLTSFLAEETYEFIPGPKADSVFLTHFPKVNPDWKEEGLLELFSELLEVRSQSSKVLEDLRREKVIGSSLDACVSITAPPALKKKLEDFGKDLRELLIVSEIKLLAGDQLKVNAEKASGEKCVRCWHYSLEIGKEEKFPGVCPKCTEALK